jgi:hypothetical protein
MYAETIFKEGFEIGYKGGGECVLGVTMNLLMCTYSVHATVF